MDLKKYSEYEKTLAEAKTARDRAAGRLAGVLEELKTEFGCSSLKEARAKLKELDKLTQEAEAAYAAAEAEFLREFADELGTD